MIKQSQSFNDDYSFEDFINAYISDNKIASLIKEKYDDAELKTLIKYNVDFCINLLSREKDIFCNYYNLQHELASEYYQNQFKNESKKVVIFDIGYNGTVRSRDKLRIHS